MSDTTSSERPRLLIPGLGGLYASLYEIAETIMRVVAGAALVTHGYSKILNPFGASGMVEGIGLFPGPAGFWSFALSVTEFFGGICIALGLLTRFWSLGAFIVLLVTVYFHWVLQGEGWGGAEKSVIWASVMFFFMIRGANRHSLDARIGWQV
ncbi:MAG TPA: DoxX family protein [Paracoccaceae bacterium]|nr:DoxX family protein [Paracoccaceae bacterium]